MVTIQRSEGLWVVGVEVTGLGKMNGTRWTPLYQCDTVEEAMAWMSYLNGGEHPRKRNRSVVAPDVAPEPHPKYKP